MALTDELTKGIAIGAILPSARQPVLLCPWTSRGGEGEGALALAFWLPNFAPSGTNPPAALGDVSPDLHREAVADSSPGCEAWRATLGNGAQIAMNREAVTQSVTRAS